MQLTILPFVLISLRLVAAAPIPEVSGPLDNPISSGASHTANGAVDAVHSAANGFVSDPVGLVNKAAANISKRQLGGIMDAPIGGMINGPLDEVVTDGPLSGVTDSLSSTGNPLSGIIGSTPRRDIINDAEGALGSAVNTAEGEASQIIGSPLTTVSGRRQLGGDIVGNPLGSVLGGVIGGSSGSPLDNVPVLGNSAGGLGEVLGNIPRRNIIDGAMAAVSTGAGIVQGEAHQVLGGVEGAILSRRDIVDGATGAFGSAVGAAEGDVIKVYGTVKGALPRRDIVDVATGAFGSTVSTIEGDASEIYGAAKSTLPRRDVVGVATGVFGGAVSTAEDDAVKIYGNAKGALPRRDIASDATIAIGSAADTAENVVIPVVGTTEGLPVIGSVVSGIGRRQGSLSDVVSSAYNAVDSITGGEVTNALGSADGFTGGAVSNAAGLVSDAMNVVDGASSTF